MSEKLKEGSAVQPAEDTEERGTLPLPYPENVMQLPSAERGDKLRILEALLFAASEPLGEDQLAEHIPEGEDIRAFAKSTRGVRAAAMAPEYPGSRFSALACISG